MTISSLTNRISYPGAGSVGPFALPFRILAAADLLVVVRDAEGVETELALTTDYAVTGVGDATAVLTLTTALAVGETLSIRRAPALEQPTSIQNQGSYFPKTHEDEFDRLTMQLQSVDDAVGRSIGVSESYDPANILLRVRPETGKVLAWQSATELGNSSLDSGATALPGAGRTVATVSAYLLNNAVFNVLDYYNVADGIDDAIAFQRAFNAACVSGGVVLVPARAGGYTFYTPIDMTMGAGSKGVVIMGQGSSNGTLTTPLILIKHAGVGFDLTGSQYLVFRDIGVRGDDVNIPKCGWLIARPLSGNSCGLHQFHNCTSRGQFSAAVVWNYGGEEDQYFGCNFYNYYTVNAKVIVWTGSNRSDTLPGGMTSSFTAIGVGTQSMLCHRIFGGGFWAGKGVDNSNKSDVFYCQAASVVSIRDAWALAGSNSTGAATGPGRAIVYVDTTNGLATNFLTIEGVRAENVGAGLQQKYFVLVGREAVAAAVIAFHVRWTIRDNYVSCGATRRAAVAIGTTNGSPNITSAGLFTQADEGASIIGAGIPVGTRIATVTNANAAVMDTNATATAGINAEIVFRFLYAGTWSQFDTLTIDANTEDRTTGVELCQGGAGTRGLAGNGIQGGFFRSISMLFRIVHADSSLFVGDVGNITITNRVNCFIFDTTNGAGGFDYNGDVRNNGTRIINQRVVGFGVAPADGVKNALTAASTQAQHNETLRALIAALHSGVGSNGLIGP